jgi:hypothetical protein
MDDDVNDFLNGDEGCSSSLSSPIVNVAIKLMLNVADAF